MTEYIVCVDDLEESYYRYTDIKPETIFGHRLREEIVRCRDCVHFRIEPWDEVLAAQYGAPPMICERTGDMDDVKPNGFCAWAERKEGGDD